MCTPLRRVDREEGELGGLDLRAVHSQRRNGVQDPLRGLVHVALRLLGRRRRQEELEALAARVEAVEKGQVALTAQL